MAQQEVLTPGTQKTIKSNIAQRLHVVRASAPAEIADILAGHLGYPIILQNRILAVSLLYNEIKSTVYLLIEGNYDSRVPAGQRLTVLQGSVGIAEGICGEHVNYGPLETYTASSENGSQVDINLNIAKTALFLSYK